MPKNLTDKLLNEIQTFNKICEMFCVIHRGIHVQPHIKQTLLSINKYMRKSGMPRCFHYGLPYGISTKRVILCNAWK
jgi:hypothetical protein